MQATGASHLIQFALEPHDTVPDQPPVNFNLAFPWAPKEAEAPALAFQVRPGPNEPRALIFQMREFNLQAAFARAGPFAKNLQDQPGAINYLAAPGAFQIALLHGAERGIHNHHPHLLVMQRLLLHLHLTFTHQGGRPPLAQRMDRGMDDGDTNGSGKPYRLRQPCFGRALPTHIANSAASGLFEGKDDGGAGGAPDARLSFRRQKSPHAARSGVFRKPARPALRYQAPPAHHQTAKSARPASRC